MANSVDPDQTAPIGAVCSRSTLFAFILNWSVMLSNYLQQTTSADDILRCFFLGALRVNEVLNQPNQQQIYYCADSLSTPVQETNMFSYALISAGPRE